ncbi:MAG: hypothetical protein R3F19_29740 [Verrucomicrobiales bacterium]
MYLSPAGWGLNVGFRLGSVISGNVQFLALFHKSEDSVDPAIGQFDSLLKISDEYHGDASGEIKCR